MRGRVKKAAGQGEAQGLTLGRTGRHTRVDVRMLRNLQPQGRTFEPPAVGGQAEGRAGGGE